jgi:hypothetical protein
MTREERRDYSHDKLINDGWQPDGVSGTSYAQYKRTDNGEVKHAFVMYPTGVLKYS